jgi:predicted GNAT family N-acyltransferase
MAHPSYKIVMQQPPGSVVAPNGFPADPRPQGAPQTFLDAMDVRIKVFCDEQNCALEPELDEDDPRSWHWVAYQTNDAGQDEPVSVIRIVPPPHGPHPNGFRDPNEEIYVKLGRVATLASHRGRGLSRLLTEEAFQWLAAHRHEIAVDYKGLVLCHAQVAVEKMYAKLGFVTDEALGHWDEEGIDHIGMWKRV